MTEDVHLHATLDEPVGIKHVPRHRVELRQAPVLVKAGTDADADFQVLGHLFEEGQLDTEMALSDFLGEVFVSGHCPETGGGEVLHRRDQREAVFQRDFQLEGELPVE